MESTTGPDAIASVGGGMLISLIFFGLLCILGFIICQVAKRVNCNCFKRDRHRIEHSSSIKLSGPSVSAEIQQLSYDSDLHHAKPTPNGTQIDAKGYASEKAVNSDADNSRSKHHLLPPKQANAQTHGSSPSSSQ